MAALPLLILALVIMNQTNLKVIRADIVYKQGEEWSRQRQWDIAIAHHKRALELAPNEDFYYLWAGSAYLEKSKSAPAQGCIITGKPDISGVLSMSVEQTAQLCRQDLLTAARTILLQARHVNPLNTDHTANLARLYKNWADLATTPEEREDYIDRSIGYYEQATVLSPQNTIVWNELATVYLYQKKDPEQAFATIAYSLELDDRYFQTYLIQGDALLTEAQAVAREMSLKQEELISASEDQKATFETDVNRLRAEWEQKLDAAIASYQQALELDPSLMNVYVTIAGAYEQMGRFEDAVATFDDAAAANPKSAQPYLGLAELYQRNNNPEAAVAAYRQAIALAPNNVDYRIALANLLESLGQPNEALLEVQEAARLKPEDPALRQSLALMYHRFQMYSEALAEARAAAQLAPDDATTQLLIGDSSRMLNDLEGAAAAYEQALAIAPDLANAWNVHLNLALIYQQSGQLDLALTHATAALQAAPEDQRSQINDFVVQLESQGAGNP
jgi:tetratricopeptide (TPR) repeat protein